MLTHKKDAKTRMHWTLIAGIGIMTACGNDADMNGGLEQPGMPGAPGMMGMQGAQGPQGPRGSDGGLIWKDATGKTVGTYIIVADLIGNIRESHHAILDAYGTVWRVEPLEANITAFENMARVYSSNNCTGTAYLKTGSDAVLPRWAVKLPSGSYGTPTNTAAPIRYLSTSSYDQGSGCVPSSYGTNFSLVFAESDIVAVQAPPSGTAPLHPERLP